MVETQIGHAITASVPFSIYSVFLNHSQWLCHLPLFHQMGKKHSGTYFPVFTFHNILNHVTLPKKLTLFSDLCNLNFLFLPISHVWILSSAFPHLCWSLLGKSHPSTDTDSFVTSGLWNHSESISFVLKVLLSFSLTYPMDLIFMTCQPLNSTSWKPKSSYFLTLGNQLNDHWVISLPL